MVNHIICYENSFFVKICCILAHLKYNNVDFVRVLCLCLFVTLSIIAVENVTKGHKTMTLQELSKQYYKDVENLTELIEEVKEKTKDYTGAKKHTATALLPV